MKLMIKVLLGMFIVVPFSSYCQNDTTVSISLGIESPLDIARFGIEHIGWGPAARLGLSSEGVIGASLRASLDLGREMLSPRCAASLDWQLFKGREQFINLVFLTGGGVGKLKSLCHPHVFTGFDIFFFRCIWLHISGMLYLEGSGSDFIINTGFGFNIIF